MFSRALCSFDELQRNRTKKRRESQLGRLSTYETMIAEHTRKGNELGLVRVRSVEVLHLSGRHDERVLWLLL